MAKTPDYPVDFRAIMAPTPCKLMWEIKGPKNTMIAWMSCYAIARNICIVQTFKGGGWNALTPNDDGKIEATVTDVRERCLVDSPATVNDLEHNAA